MQTKLWTTVLIFSSFLTLSACQTTVQKSTPMDQANQVIDIPVVDVILDSDGDGYSDDIDECPGTPMNIVTDERGCPYSGVGIGLRMEYRAFFANGSSELSKEYQLELDKVAAKLQEFYTATMSIEGHASTDEISATDLRPNSLSMNRALIVENYLIMQHKINPNRLSTSSYGTERPIASNDTEEGKSMNRRVYGIATADFDTEEEMSMNRRVFEVVTEPED